MGMSFKFIRLQDSNILSIIQTSEVQQLDSLGRQHARSSEACVQQFIFRVRDINVLYLAY